MSRFPLVAALTALAAAGAVLVLAERFYRELEVRLAGAILDVITTSGVYVAGDREAVYFGLGGTTPFGLRMTPECSSAFLLLPLLVVSMAMVYFRPSNARRIFFSLGISALVVVLVNQLRILTIVGLVHWFGTDEGYYWGHTLLGSMVSVFGGAVSLVLFVWLSTRKKKA
ncbi:exosortase P [Amycolatopsis sp. NEAU-NG30]|jgi:exosortase/archaeosortase family protein|uniref:Exosortase P n=1 Tax=Amycolatopsis melonis TaxID=3156488 RepID=A0ABV0LKW1_9PSEU